MSVSVALHNHSTTQCHDSPAHPDKCLMPSGDMIDNSR
jgi:hypothetical protein